MGWTVRGSKLEKVKNPLFPKTGHTGSGTHSAFHSTGTKVIFWGYSGQGMMLSPHLHPESRLSINGATPLFHIYAFMG